MVEGLQGSPSIESGKAMIRTLVMIPGLGSDAAIWQRTIAALDGAVDCLVGDTLSDETLHGMAQRILDQAPETFALAGVSMGGMVALQMLRIAPHRVTRLALIDTNARRDTMMRKTVRYLSNFAAAIAPDFDKLSRRSVSSLVHPSTSEDVRTEIARMGARVGAECYIRQTRAVAARKDLRPILRSITVPTAVVVGAADTVTPVKLSQEIHDLTPRSTLHIIPDCGHLPPIEKPADLAVILLELMKCRSSTK
jgi:pimeloyl-ACP methyl ester carboxylesterase